MNHNNMDFNGFHEEKYYSKKELACLSDTDISNLISKKILVTNQGSIFKFSFVGVISNSKTAFFVLPKVWKSTVNEEAEQIKSTLKSLKSYKNENKIDHDGVDYFKSEPDNPECSELSIAEFIIRDFKNNGVYEVHNEVLEQNGNGEINWPLTINNIDPAFSNKQPIYTDTINHAIYNYQDHLTIDIHKWGINYVYEKYSHLLDEGHIKPDHNSKEIENLGKSKFLISHLTQELNETFSDRGIRLLKSLLFLIKKNTPSLNEAITLYGTRKYENVWEDICRKITKDSYSVIKKINEEKLFPNPIWNTINVKNWEQKKTHIPDILSYDANKKEYYLFDAKYYLIKYENNEISGEPGYHDVVKQFLYQVHLEESLKTKAKNTLKTKVKNAFLLPILDETFLALKNNKELVSYNSHRAVIGFISYELFPSKKIWVIMCPFSKWQQMYIQNKSLEFPDIFWSE